MDRVYYWIIFVGFLLLVLDQYNKDSKKMKEGFEVEAVGEGYYPGHVLKSNVSGVPSGGYIGTTNYNVGVGTRARNSKRVNNYMKFGATPPRPRCNITLLGGNCRNYDYDTSQDKNESVCQQSVNTYPYDVAPYRESDFRFPLYVMGKTIGRTRECKQLYSPSHYTGVNF